MDMEKSGSTGRPENFYRGRKVLIPGGAGFIGSRLAGRLSSLGAAVTVVDPRDKYCGGNLFNLRTCRQGIRIVRKKIEAFIRGDSLRDFSCIFNCAGLSDHHLGLVRPDIDYRINCQSGIALLQRLAETGIEAKIVSIGSRSQYGKGGSGIVESDPLQPLDIQAVHKTALEYYHTVYGKAFGLDFIYLRLTNTYGPGQRMKGKGIGFIGEIIRNSLDHQEIVIYGSLDRVKDLIYVEDVVDAMLYAGIIKGNSDPVFNIGGQSRPVGELIECVRKELPGIQVKVQEFPENIKKMDAGDAVLNSEKFFSRTGWSPRTALEEGISRMIEYYRNHKRHYWKA
jgi:nucleoside-diphosphate-sugar epimerase